MATHFHALKIKEVRSETADCVSLSFEVPNELADEYKFVQGQNITLRTTLGGEEFRRSYSICSSPSDNELRVAIKKQEGGRFSSHANKNLIAGDYIDVLPPTGQFFTRLRPDQAKHYLALAAGSGITPLLSIIKATLAVESSSTFTLVYGNRNRSSIIFKDALDNLKDKYMERFSLYHILSRERMEAEIYQGRINAEKCKELSKGLIDFNGMDEIFICGPEEMIFGVRNWLLARSYDSAHIHFELFTPSEQKPRTEEEKAVYEKQYGGKSAAVTVKIDGISFDFDLPYNGDSILNTALACGADLPYACKGGVCATCKAKLVSGEIEMDTNYALEPEELKQGFILTCQSHPRSEKVVVDYDSR